ncbi:MAG TPA: type II toxin-antitoxin system VapC family toxin [Gaiellaceae bacterium]|nr:type II toxin-antitoxin system VapC family toxin [Gaiellaceae bacterium]
MIVLDTTVLVYAVGSEHPLREPSRKLIDAIAAGRVDATTTAEVIQEFVHVRARRRGRTDAAKAGRNFADLLAPLLVIPEASVETGLRIFERSKSLGVFDSFLAATALAHGADALVSADRAFSSVAYLKHVVPGTPAFDRLLAA